MVNNNNIYLYLYIFFLIEELGFAPNMQYNNYGSHGEQYSHQVRDFFFLFVVEQLNNL